MSFAVPKLPFRRVPRTEVATTRPALESAGYACEACGRPDDIRVAEGYGQHVVLCAPCLYVPNAFLRVLGKRKAIRRTVTAIETAKGAVGRVHSDRPPTTAERTMIRRIMDAAIDLEKT